MPKYRPWDMESGICPYGHKIEECNKPRLMKGIWVNICKIHRAEVGSQRQRRDYVTDKKVVAYQSGWWKGPLNAALGTFNYSGYLGRTVHDPICVLTLVCRHEVKYKRTSTRADAKYWCVRCDSWKYAHEISAYSKSDRAIVWWPLEEHNLFPRRAANHAKNAGSGRA